MIHAWTVTKSWCMFLNSFSFFLLPSFPSPFHRPSHRYLCLKPTDLQLPFISCHVWLPPFSFTPAEEGQRLDTSRKDLTASDPVSQTTYIDKYFQLQQKLKEKSSPHERQTCSYSYTWGEREKVDERNNSLSWKYKFQMLKKSRKKTGSEEARREAKGDLRNWLFSTFVRRYFQRWAKDFLFTLFLSSLLP